MQSSLRKFLILVAVAGLLLIGASPVRGQNAGAAGGRGGSGGGGRGGVTAWAFKPAVLPPFIAPNRPQWKLADILAAHAGKGDWAEPVVRDTDVFVQYISMAPGGKTPVSQESDAKMWFVIQSGKAQVSIHGQEPFVATKDFIVQIPMRTAWNMETVGDEPSLRLEVRIQDDGPLFPVADNPAPPKAPPGYTAVKVRTGGAAGEYGEGVKPYLDFQTDFVQANKSGNISIVRDPHGFAAIIRGPAVPVPPASSLGHFHLNEDEFWFIMEGEVDFQIEGVPDLIRGHDGDVVYGPRGRYHRPTVGGTGMGTRLNMGGAAENTASASLTPADGN
jgi:mannose-6-phosphate isomerase-like protein (cupin superfamily)